MAHEINDIQDLHHEILDVLAVSAEGLDFRLVGRDSARYRLTAADGKLAVETLAMPEEPTMRKSALSEEPVPETAAEAAETDKLAEPDKKPKKT